MKRMIDIIFSAMALVVLALPALVIALVVAADGHRPFFVQERIGRGGKPFGLIKFRTMRPAAESAGQLTVGMRDPRITRAGHFLRKYKLDELPQLWNVFTGKMSLVGPRPEVSKYVALYTDSQRRVLSVRPGLTDYASLFFIRENELLGAAANPEKTYVNEILPAKLDLALRYIDEQGMGTDLKIMWLTFRKIISGK